MKNTLMEYCKGTKIYHRPKIRLENSEVVIEFCENCKQEEIFTKDKQGRIDKDRYRIFHARDGLQAGHPRFEYEYAING